jgi:hypothetical protein
MTVTRVLDEEDRRVLDLLRAYGLDEQVRHYESLLRAEERFALQPDPLPDPVPGAVSVAEAAKRLGLTSEEVRLHVELGLLAAEPDPETNEHLITNASIAWLLDAKRGLAKIVPFPWEGDEPVDPNSLFGQMTAPRRRDQETREE